jgi:hypothetical protein
LSALPAGANGRRLLYWTGDSESQRDGKGWGVQCCITLIDAAKKDHGMCMSRLLFLGSVHPRVDLQDRNGIGLHSSMRPSVVRKHASSCCWKQVLP